MPKPPHTLDDCTAAWMTEVLLEIKELKDGEKVTAVETKNLGEGRGFVGLNARISCTYEPAGVSAPASFVIKMPNPALAGQLTNFEPEAIQMVNELFQIEAYWYSKAWATRVAGVKVPKFYWTAEAKPEDPTKSLGDYVLMMEDLGGDLELLDQAKTGTDMAHAKDFVTALGRLHAFWWEHP